MRFLPTGLRCFPALAVPVLAGVLLILSPGSVHAADKECANWNTWEFFQNADAAKVRECLASGADPNARGEHGYTPLHWADESSEDAQAIFRALIDAGANVNAVANDGRTPLHSVMWGADDTAVIEILIEAGADPERYKRTPAILPCIGRSRSESDPAVSATLLQCRRRS